LNRRSWIGNLCVCAHLSIIKKRIKMAEVLNEAKRELEEETKRMI
jgi:hypothetical protein